MKTLRPLDEITLPPLPAAKEFRQEVFGQTFSFPSLKALLGAADFSKAGDRNAGLAAKDELEREVAREILSSQTIRQLYDSPLSADSVMRVNYDIDTAVLGELSELTLGELKDRLLEVSGAEALRIGTGLTGVIVAALAKIMDVHELITVAAKIHCPTRARTRLGLPGTLSSRLQPNHPTDDLRGITLLVYAGLSCGAGDALVGVNPAVDTVENISLVLRHLDKLRRRTGAPTQICVLSHVKTQLACLAQGAPVEILFQSLAGTEATNSTEFDITVDLLDEAYRVMADRRPIKESEQFMYFETGQGSEFTYGKHDGMDMTTTEALCYGLARRYDPFMVNNVTGFIGPETHLDNMEMILSNLQDHFMGKLMGLPMGMAPCYTLHSQITLDGQQAATQLLTAAGANYYMDVHLNTDRMLAYFDTSAYDDQTLREVHAKKPAPEYLEWAIAKGIFQRDGAAVKRGPNWGNAALFCETPEELSHLKDSTPALHGFETAGPRAANSVSRKVRLHQAAARQATYAELDPARLEKAKPFRLLSTRARSKAEHLNSPHAGSKLSDESRESLTEESARVQIVISDGLSAEAVHENMETFLPTLLEGLAAKSISYGEPFLVRYGRVKLGEEIAARTTAELVVLLLGERPGGDAWASRSLSAYLIYRLADRFEYSVISNIYSKGLPPLEAASVVLEKAEAVLKHRAAGNRLEALLTT